MGVRRPSKLSNQQTMETITVTAKKTLIHGDGSISFIKGKEYKVTGDRKYYEGGFSPTFKLTENTCLIDEQGQPHYLGGGYHKQFTIN
jgi:hypothetical protein